MSVSYLPDRVSDNEGADALDASRPRLGSFGHRANARRPDPAPNVAAALSTAAMVALHAPAVGPDRSWHWRVGTERVDLYADRWRQPVTSDPASRQLMLSCGMALHHARIALRAVGYLPSVRRLPDRNRPDLVASLAADKPIPVASYARELLRAALRRPDDGRFAEAPVPPGALQLLREVAGSEGALLDLLDPVGAAPPGRYAALYGSGDRAAAWLRCGEALSAVWLSATARGLGVRPAGVVVDPAVWNCRARRDWRPNGAEPAPRVDVAQPYLLVCVGVLGDG